MPLGLACGVHLHEPTARNPWPCAERYHDREFEKFCYGKLKNERVTDLDVIKIQETEAKRQGGMQKSDTPTRNRFVSPI